MGASLGPAHGLDQPQRPAAMLLEHRRHRAPADAGEGRLRAGGDGFAHGYAGPHRGPDAFREIGGGEARGIAGQIGSAVE